MLYDMDRLRPGEAPDIDEPDVQARHRSALARPFQEMARQEARAFARRSARPPGRQSSRKLPRPMPLAPAQVVRADPSRLYLRLPCLLLSAAAAAAVLTPTVEWLLYGNAALKAVMPACMTYGLISLIALLYIRFVYVRYTRLILDADGLRFDQPFASCMARWTQVQSTTATTPWDPTFKGWIAAGVRLRLTDGRTCFIPDVLRVKRDDVANLLSHYSKVGSPPGYVGYGEGGVLTDPFRRRYDKS